MNKYLTPVLSIATLFGVALVFVSTSDGATVTYGRDGTYTGTSTQTVISKDSVRQDGQTGRVRCSQSAAGPRVNLPGSGNPDGGIPFDPCATVATVATDYCTNTGAANTIPCRGSDGTINGVVTNTPTIVDNISGHAYSRAVYQSWPYIYVGHSDGVAIFDVTRPEEMRELTGITPPVGFTANAALDGDGQYLYTLMYSDEGAKFYLVVYNLARPGVPVFESTTEITANGSHPNGLRIQGKYLYVIGGGWSPGSIPAYFQTYDITLPTAPVYKGRVAVQYNARGLDVVAGGIAFVATGSATPYFYAIDATTVPTAPSIVGTLALPQQGFTVQAIGSYALVVGTYLMVVDIHDPTTPTLVGTPIAVGESYYSWKAQNLLYATDVAVGRLLIYDVTDPTAPTLAGSLTGLAAPMGIAGHGSHAFVASYAATADFYSIALGGGIVANTAEIASLHAGQAALNRADVQGKLTAGNVLVGKGGIAARGPIIAENIVQAPTPSVIPIAGSNTNTASCTDTNCLLNGWVHHADQDAFATHTHSSTATGMHVNGACIVAKTGTGTATASWTATVTSWTAGDNVVISNTCTNYSTQTSTATVTGTVSENYAVIGASASSIKASTAIYEDPSTHDVSIGNGTTSASATLEVNQGTGWSEAKALRISGSHPSMKWYSTAADAAARNWGFIENWDAYGDFAIMQSTARLGDPTNAGLVRLRIKTDGSTQALYGLYSGASGTAQGFLNLYGATSGSFKLDAAAAAGSVTVHAPTSLTAGWWHVDGSGNSSFTTPTAADVGAMAAPSLTTGRVPYASGSATLADTAMVRDSTTFYPNDNAYYSFGTDGHRWLYGYFYRLTLGSGTGVDGIVLTGGSGAGTIRVNGASGVGDGILEIGNGADSYVTRFIGTQGQGQDRHWNMPATYGTAGDCVVGDGSGTLSWGTCGSGSGLSPNGVGDGTTWSVARFTNGQAVSVLAATPANIGAMPEVASSAGWLHDNGTGTRAWTTPTPANIGIAAAGAGNGSTVATAGGYEQVTLSSASISVTALNTVIVTSTASATSNTGNAATCGLSIYIDSTAIGPSYGVGGGTTSNQPRTALAITGAQGSLSAGMHTVYTKLWSGQEGTVCTVGANESYMTIQML
jgi:hypothetical protein